MKRMVLFTLFGKNLALHLEQMVHITQGAVVFPLPRMPREIAGVIIMSDTLIPVLHGNVVAGTEAGLAEGATGHPYSLVVDSEYGNIGLPADKVRQIVAADRGLLGPTGIEQKHLDAETFIFDNSTFHIINIDYLVLDMLQGLGRRATEAYVARRHQ